MTEVFNPEYVWSFSPGRVYWMQHGAFIPAGILDSL